MKKSYADTKRFRLKNPWYRALEYAKRRCTDPKHKSYPWYGALGIKCEMTYLEVRVLWFRDCGDLMVKASLDRIDPKGNYCFDNCRFIEYSENSNWRSNHQVCSENTPEPKDWDE